MSSGAALLKTWGTSLFMMLGGIATGSVIAVALQPEGRGILAAAILWPNIVALTGVLGVHWGVVRRMQLHAGAADDVAAGALQSTLLLCGPWIALLAVALPFLLPATDAAMLQPARVALLVVPTGALLVTMQSIEQARGTFGRFNRTRLVQTAAYLVLVTATFALPERTPTLFVWALVLSQLAGILSLSPSLVGLVVRRAGLAQIRPLLRESGPFGFLVLLEVLLAQTAPILVIALLAREEVGLYAVGQVLAGGMLPLSSSVATLLLRRCTDEREARDIARVGFRQLALVHVVLFAAFALAVPIFVHLVLGASYAASIPPALLVGAGYAFKGPFDVLDTAMRGLGRVTPVLVARVVGIAVTAGLGFAWRDALGLDGFALATAIGLAAGSLVIYGFARRHLGIRAADVNPFRISEVRALCGRTRSAVASLRGH